MKPHLAIGVDIGGTKVAAGLVDSSGQIIERTRRPIMVRASCDDALSSVLQAIESVRATEAAKSYAISGIGLSSPGFIDPFEGRVLKAANLPCWVDYPLASKVSEATGLRAILDNDGNAAALAESTWGAGVDYNCVFYVTLGTGIGTGIVINRTVFRGRTGSAGEGGHITIDYDGPKCPCGKRGCIEQYAAGPAIARRARLKLGVATAVQQNVGRRRVKRKSRMLELADGHVQKITAEIVGKAALEADPLASDVMRETADYLAIWLGGIIDLLEPDVIVVGGGIGHLMGTFFALIRSQLEHWSIAPRASEIPIKGAIYGEASGIAGAAALLLNQRG